MNIALALGETGCGSGSSNASTPSTATDVTVECGKVYDANVTDSSTPAQVAVEKVVQKYYSSRLT